MASRTLHALGASLLFLVAAAVVVNTAGQGIATGMLGGVSAAFAPACLLLAGTASAP